MINMNISKDLQGVQGWTQLANILGADKTESVKNATVELENNAIQVTVTDGATTRQVTISAPDLGQVEGELDPDVLAKVAEDIKSVAASLELVGDVSSPEVARAITKLQTDLAASMKGKAAGVGLAANSVNTSKALFDLYALMALMVQVAQTQRDKAREIRLVENQQVQNSIQQQADQIRSAANIALGFGIASAVIAGASSIACIIGQAVSFKQQSAATRQINLPAKNLEAAKMATNPGVAANKLQALNGTEKGRIGSEYMYRTFHKGANQTPEAFAAFENDFKAQIEPARLQVETAEQAQKKAGQEFTAAKNNPDTAPDVLNAKRTAYEEACVATREAKANYHSIEQEFFGKLETQMKANEVEITHLQEKASTAGRSEAKAIKQRLNSLENKNDYLRLYTAKMKGEYASTETKNVDLQMAQRNYDEAKTSLNLDSKFTNSQQWMGRWMAINQLSTTLSQMLGSAGTLRSEQERAAATEQGVEQTQHNEQLDQIKDLFQQAESVVQSVIQLMQAVMAAENESVMKTIRA